MPKKLSGPRFLPVPNYAKVYKPKAEDGWLVSLGGSLVKRWGAKNNLPWPSRTAAQNYCDAYNQGLWDMARRVGAVTGLCWATGEIKPGEAKW